MCLNEMKSKENQPNDCIEFQLSLTNLFGVWKSTSNSNVAALLVLVFSWKGYPVYSSLHTLIMISNNIITHFFTHHREATLPPLIGLCTVMLKRILLHRVLFQFESFQKPAALLHTTYKSYTNARMTLECISTLTLNCDQISVALGLQH